MFQTLGWVLRTQKLIFASKTYRHIIPFFLLIFHAEFDSGEKNAKYEVKNFPILNIRGKIKKIAKILKTLSEKKRNFFSLIPMKPLFASKLEDHKGLI